MVAGITLVILLSMVNAQAPTTILPSEYDLLLRWSAVWILGLVLVNLWIIDRRAAKLVTAGRLTSSDRRLFFRGVLVWAFAGVAEPAVLRFLAPDVSLPDLVRLPPRQVVGWIHWMLVDLALAWALLWLWRGRGADLLAAMAPAFGRTERLERTYRPERVRLWVTIAIILIIAGNLLGGVLFALTGLPVPPAPR